MTFKQASSNMTQCGHISINRTLWYKTNEEKKRLTQDRITTLDGPLVILGEAGMGKSHLLEVLASSSGYRYCSARKLINRPNPKTLLSTGEVLVIDALDEVSSQKDGDAVDLVLRQLGELDYPKFIMSCRVADWRSATGLQAIHEQYDTNPMELHLDPFSEQDTIEYLSFSLGANLAKNTIEHFSSRSLGELLGNPQTLDLISRVAKSGFLPESRSELFESAIEILRVEHRNTSASMLPAKAAGLAAAGAAFAGLILTGNESIARLTELEITDGELLLSEISQLPGGEYIEAMIGTRLFKALGSDNFSYLHRQIGEYLGAKWLADQANTSLKRKRLLSFFHSYSLVPSSLRGIHAWLSIDPALTSAVIKADPMGLLEYGNADDLTPNHSRLLIKELESLQIENPRLQKWRSYSARGLAKIELIDDIRRITSTSKTTFYLSMILLDAIKGSIVAKELAEHLEKISLNTDNYYAIRLAASEALKGINTEESWLSLLEKLKTLEDEDSARLGVELLDEIGYELVPPHTIIDIVIRHSLKNRRMTGALYGVKHNLPTSKIKETLNQLVAKNHLKKQNNTSKNGTLTNFAHHLISRIIATNEVSAEELWHWLEPLQTSQDYNTESRKKLYDTIKENDHLRQSLQYNLMISSGKNPREMAWEIGKRSSALFPSEDDLIVLLSRLPPQNTLDERWKEILTLVNHDGDKGKNLRDAAKPFTSHSIELQNWVNSLADREISDWEIKAEKSQAIRAARRKARFFRHRRYYNNNSEHIRSGEWNYIIDPAHTYLNLFSEIENAPAHERIARWLGHDIAEIAHIGFEAYLKKSPPHFTANDIATALAEDQHYEAANILVAALAERVRNGVSFDDLSDERLMAVFFELSRSCIDSQAGLAGLKDIVETELRRRKCWQLAVCLYYEPQLAKHKKHVDGLSIFLSSEHDKSLSAELAAKWILQFPKLPNEPQMQLADRLLSSGNYEALRKVDFSIPEIDTERDRNWKSIALLLDFKRASKKLTSCNIAPELLWHLRSRIYGTGRYNINFPLDVSQCEWIINTFRKMWPMTSHPIGTSSGDNNKWDASDFIQSLIKHIGNTCTEESSTALEKLQDFDIDGYTPLIKTTIMEQNRNIVESAYNPPSVEEINSIVNDLPPKSLADLQAVVIEELAIVQAKVKSDDVESWRGFYDDSNAPFQEERCRDHLLGLLRQGRHWLTYEPEAHVAADKEVDITCSLNQLRLPIEIKGQWHADLWSGADKQLDKLYAQDWRAEGRGIYLVLWFGEQKSPTKKLKNPERGAVRPTSPDELKEMLTSRNKCTQQGRVLVVVLDLTHSA